MIFETGGFQVPLMLVVTPEKTLMEMMCPPVDGHIAPDEQHE